jgi:hypothetical protein
MAMFSEILTESFEFDINFEIPAEKSNNSIAASNFSISFGIDFISFAFL